VCPVDPSRTRTARPETVDLAIVGAGAAGLATAIFAARRAPGLRVRCIDGARHIGAKILVSGGSRCNVTNRVVTERDFWGGSPRIVARVLRAFPPERAVTFFNELGVTLHEEEDAKLFPDTNRSRTVLDALLSAIDSAGASIALEQRVSGIRRHGDAFAITTADGKGYAASRVVLATGGRSLPKTGSDGVGYELARRLGHGYVETTPALAPLVLDGGRHASLSGVAHRVALTLRANDRVRVRLEGPLLWTHFGASGPVVLNMSRHWHRARLEGEGIDMTVNVCPDDTFESLERWVLDQERERPRAQVSTVLAGRLPAAVADAWIAAAHVGPTTTLAHLTREERRRLIHTLLETRFDVRDSRGYAYAEVTAGGIPLDEVDPATLESRVCPGLHLVGEILDVDGRLGGFNFQWAWASGWVAGNAAARALSLNAGNGA
jgi:predicted Rossmann fold flavoprotein